MQMGENTTKNGTILVIKYQFIPYIKYSIHRTYKENLTEKIGRYDQRFVLSLKDSQQIVGKQRSVDRLTHIGIETDIAKKDMEIDRIFPSVI